MPSIFVLGATGYIGGPVILALLREIPGLTATALVRNEKHFGPLSELGVTCIKGTHKDTPLITDLASGADIVLNAADADDAAMVQAILLGCKLKFESTSVKSVYIHTSGVAVLPDQSQGIFDPSSPIYDDRNPEPIKAVSPSALHRNVEQMVVDADEAGYVSAYIVCPAVVYGDAQSPVPPRPTFLLNLLIMMSSAIKALPISGQGTNVIPYVHMKDLAAAYVIVIKHGLSGKDAESGYGRYYIVTGVDIAWKDVVHAYGKAMKQRGMLPTSDPMPVTTEQVPLMSFFGANTRTIPGRLQDLGWRPESTSLFDDVEHDVERAQSLN